VDAADEWRGAMTIIGAILLGLTLPLTAIQILWINMVTTVALGLTLAFEPPEPDVMRRPPRPGDEPLLSAFLVWRVAFVSALFMLVPSEFSSGQRTAA
jgi:magnesium-transporting ATPase (P-type)